jgi:hypothetical protein
LKKIYVLAMAILLASCATNQNTTGESTAKNDSTQTQGTRTPSVAGDLSGDYLGEGLFSGRTSGLRRPAMRIYLQRAQGEADSYYGVLLEYDQLLNMGLPYLASQKAPIFNKMIGYLNSIATHISAYKLLPGTKQGTYEMHVLDVRNGQLVPQAGFTMTLNLNLKNTTANALADATISGNSDGQIVFPGGSDSSPGVLAGIAEALTMSQYKLASIVYKKGHLASTWRGNWKDLEGSYLSEYGRFKDGVLELYSDSQQKMKFTKTNTTKAKYFTNPKSATIEGDYTITEPVPKMYILTPSKGTRTASDIEMGPRIGLFLDVFDGSAPEAGSHLVTELAFTNPKDPEDFMMYYEHPQHLRNVGVEPAPKK